MNWSEKSAKFYSREFVKDGEGRRGLVHNALIDHNTEKDFSSLSDREVSLHLHIAKVHNDVTKSSSQDITAMMHETVRDGVEAANVAMQNAKSVYKDAVMQTLAKQLGDGSLDGLSKLQSMLDSAFEEADVEIRHSVEVSKKKINFPTDDNKIRRCYTEGAHSILKNLPIPVPKRHLNCAYISAEHIVNHVLASGLEVLEYRVGGDWVNEDGEYECEFIKEMHEEVKRMMEMEGSEVTEDTRVYIIRVWSDGFEAFDVKGNNEYNNLQLFTVTVMPPRGKCINQYTLPFALCYKQKSHSDIFLKLLEEVHDMSTKVTYRYCGRTKSVVKTIVKLQMVMQDYPERCSNSCISQLGVFCHRWGYTCYYDHEVTPSCSQCALSRIRKVLDETDDVDTESAGCNGDECSDFWSPTHTTKQEHYTGVSTYPIEPGQILDKVAKGKIPTVEQSFDLLANAISSLEAWYTHSSKKKREKETICKKYFQAVGLATNLSDEIVNDLHKGIPMEESSSYPALLKQFKKLGISLKHFATLPMHMAFLGVEKSLIRQTLRLVNRKRKEENNLWDRLTTSMQESQKVINSISIDWCMSMSFSGRDESKIGTASWQSDHYSAFSRLSLVHFGSLDRISVPGDKTKAFKVFKNVRVLWFCLMASIFADEKVSSNRVDNLVKLFLTACKNFNDQTEKAVLEEETEQSITESGRGKKRKKNSTDLEQDDTASNNKSSSKKRKKEEDNSEHKTKKRKKDSSNLEEDDTTRNESSSKKRKEEGSKRKRKTKGPFYSTTVNYFSLLNMKAMIDAHASMKEAYEGGSESYIQNCKKQLDTSRHTVEFLVTILTKLVTDLGLSLIDRDNPFNNQKEYARTYNWKIYNNIENVGDLVDNQQALIGVVDKQDRLFVCVENKTEKRINLHPLIFDDGEGQFCYNLWYAPAAIGEEELTLSDRHAVLKHAVDFFVMLRPAPFDEDMASGPKIDQHWTVICRSWRVRVKEGLQLPKPQKEVLLSIYG